MNTNWNKVEKTLEQRELLRTKYNKKKSEIKSKSRNLKYFTTEVEASHAELKIMIILDKNRIKYLREVSFDNFVTEKGGHYRFDFYFPDKNLIIEYDGKNWHKDKTNDEIKNNFCKKNKIRLVRLTASDYYKLEKSIKNILIL